MALLEVAGLSKAFGGVRALRDVSFHVREGEVLGVMGPNGSGKTTLFNLISGVLAPDAGGIRFRGRDVTGLPPHRITARGLARTFQHVRPFVGLTALENVLVGQYFGRQRVTGRPALAAADRLLARVGLAGKAAARAGTLTVVERKRLELARALATGPDLVLLDEFMAGLNPSETAGAMALIRDLRADGITVVLVEHIVWALLDLSDRIVVLSAGEKIADAPPAEVAADPGVVDADLGSGARG